MTLAWSYGGVTLATYGRVTLIDDYFDIPDRRGGNIEIAYNHGTIFTQKYYNERKMTFGIAIRAASATALETVMDDLRKKIGLQTQQTLSQTREDATIRTAPATVDIGIQPQRHGSKTVLAVLTFTLSSPFFRLSTPIASSLITVNATPKAWTVTNPGTIAEYEPKLILTGPLLNTVITNSANGYVLTYTGTIASPRIVTIQKTAGQWVATNDLNANVIGNITHSGGPELMRFDVGANILSIADGTHTTGIVETVFNAPFL